MCWICISLLILITLQVSQSSHAENGGSANGNNNADKGSP
jgi:hypothetical protein